ncbi:hypothetical protein WOLCODRAFT_159006 [Wolfiporia cocos MD-104 SS10]|uniref:Uncharacterized protein n=1 Tax=Wolfiporia cocos (strain MD-104) TaxID=742152 RepID=A0A2H3JTL3_WOLCO|nr:hypothetical protein WOLCODRAFT_159006 [Wolfiporia cocos MD-104 SS10]
MDHRGDRVLNVGAAGVWASTSTLAEYAGVRPNVQPDWRRRASRSRREDVHNTSQSGGGRPHVRREIGTEEVVRSMRQIFYVTVALAARRLPAREGRVRAQWRGSPTAARTVVGPVRPRGAGAVSGCKSQAAAPARHGGSRAK